MDREDEMGKPCSIRVSVQVLHMKDGPVEKPGKGEKHPDNFYQDEQNRKLQQNVDYLLGELLHFSTQLPSLFQSNSAGHSRVQSLGDLAAAV